MRDFTRKKITMTMTKKKENKMTIRKTDEFYLFSHTLDKWIWKLKSGIFSKDSDKDQSKSWIVDFKKSKFKITMIEIKSESEVA